MFANIEKNARLDRAFVLPTPLLQLVGRLG
jgi:hypothetical protein